MKNNPLTNQDFAALANGLPVSLTTTLEGTGTASAWMEGDKIIVDCAAAQSAKYVQLTTPINFDVLDVMTIHGNATACTITVANGANAISDAISIAASDTDIDRASEIDNAYYSFAKDDNDLRITPGTAAFTGRIIITISK